MPSLPDSPNGKLLVNRSSRNDFIDHISSAETSFIPKGLQSQTPAAGPSPYSREDRTVLEALGISSREWSQEAESALNHIDWLERKKNLQRALAQTEAKVRANHEMIEELFGAEIADKVSLKSTVGLKVRGADGRLSPRFIGWFSTYCTYDEEEGLHEYSAEKFARGDYIEDSKYKPDLKDDSNSQQNRKVHAQAIRLALRHFANDDRDFMCSTTDTLWVDFLDGCQNEDFDGITNPATGVSLMQGTDKNGNACIQANWRERKPGGNMTDKSTTVSRASFDRYVKELKDDRSGEQPD